MREQEIEPHKILEMAIPRGKARVVANMLGVSESLVTKWARETASDENPHATGTPNPIERVDRIFDFMLIYSPEAAAVLASRYPSKLEEFYLRMSRTPLSDSDWQSQIARCLREAAEAISALVENASAETVRKEWEEAKLAIEEIVRRKEAGEQETKR